MFLYLFVCLNLGVIMLAIDKEKLFVGTMTCIQWRDATDDDTDAIRILCFTGQRLSLAVAEISLGKKKSAKYGYCVL